MNSAILGTLLLILLPTVGIFPVIFQKSKMLRYIAFVFCPFALCVCFSLQMLRERSTLILNWFKINNISFEYVLTYNLMEVLLCIVIIAILACVQLACIRLEKMSNITQLKTQLLLNLFVATMCFTIASGNLLSFFIGIESLGIISATLVGRGNKAVLGSARTFIFDKFASLLFLIAIVVIANETGSFDLATVEIFFDDIDNHTNLVLPAFLLLIACLCKGAQFPFSRWLIDATVADSYVSIILHSATIVGVGIIFITKCYFILEQVFLLKYITVTVGIFTAVIMSLSSMCHTNVKKIIACSTSASMGCIFVACGVGEYSAAILYFSCHAFFKSVFFLSFVYVMHAVSKEKNILKMGGINKVIPNVVDIVWIAFASTIGLPFFVSFFGKVALLSSLFYSENFYLLFAIVFVNVVLILSFIRLIMVSIYGKSRMDEKTLSRVDDMSGSVLVSTWILLTVSVFGSFIFWSMYEWGLLHFGMPGCVYFRDFTDYVIENSFELAQIAFALLIAIIIRKKRRFTINNKVIEHLMNSFREDAISEGIINGFYKLSSFIMRVIANFDLKLNNLINKGGYYVSDTLAHGNERMYKSSVLCGLKFIMVGIAISIIYLVLWRVYG